jgi:hypothetical protein
MEFGGLDTCSLQPPQMPDALGGYAFRQVNSFAGMDKLYVPRVRAELVSRPRLTERLNEGVTCKLTLVSALAGFGKTTLPSEWASHFGIGDRIARRKGPKGPPGLTPLQIRRACGGVL